MNPDVTVVIATYNAMQFIDRTVQSVMEQTIGRDRVELLAVDDCSTDGTYEELQRLASQWGNMRALRLESNSGAAATPRNRGMAEARGRYIFILDHDDYLGPEALERMVAMGDKNESDVVLGKMFSGGGRGVPRTMFTKNQPDADLYDSRVYWNLSPMKLYRRELIERLGLRFPEDMRFHEDQVFVSQVYFAASRISVVADYDCVCWYHREDRGNLSLRISLAELLTAHERMLDIITSNVEPGKKRDRLLQRHFQIDFIHTARRLSDDRPGDENARERGFEELRALVREHYHGSIGMHLRPVHRIAYELIARGLFEDLPELFEFERSGERGPLLVEDERVYEVCPFFRDENRGLPDYCYNVGHQVKVLKHLSALEWDGDGLVISGSAYLHRLDAEITAVRLVARLRGAEEVFTADAQFGLSTMSQPPEAEEPRDPGADRAVSFTGVMDVRLLASSRSAGLWDLYVEVSSGRVQREARLGAEKNADIDITPVPRFIGSGGAHVATPYYTDPFGNLTIDIDQHKHRLRRPSLEPPSWDEADRATVDVRGRVIALNVPAGAISVRLSDVAGHSYDIAATTEERASETVFAAGVALKTAAAGRPLLDGDWDVTVCLETEGVSLETAVPDKSGLATIRWWRGMRPMHAKSLRSKGKLRLRIKPVDLTHAVKRRLGLVSSRGGDS